MTTIPTINLAPIYQNHSEESYKQIASQIKDIYSEIGFCYLINHNISHSLIDKIFQLSELFFDLPLEVKMSIKQDRSFKGYIPINSSTTIDSTLKQYTTLPNNNEAFMIAESQQMYEDRERFPKFDLIGDSKWIEALAIFPEANEFKTTLLEYRAEVKKLVQDLFKVFAYAFNISWDELMLYLAEPTTFLRLTSYPPVINKEQFGFAPHTDMGFFALLLQDSIGGLEVQTQNGNWIPVTPIPYSFVLNSSDMMKFMTNNQIIATPHRVISSEKTRKSVAFFVDPALDAEIKVLSSFKNQEAEKTFIYREHILGRANTNYGT
jgi:isopenicillin N synthase-like dioxygenase